MYVTFPQTVDQAVTKLAGMLTMLDVTSEPGWLTDARNAWSAVTPGPPRQAVVSVRRKPWVVVDDETFATDVLRHLGVTTCTPSTPTGTRGPPSTRSATGDQIIVLLPDEPYLFSPHGGPEAFPIPLPYDA